MIYVTSFAELLDAYRRVENPISYKEVKKNEETIFLMIDDDNAWIYTLNVNKKPRISKTKLSLKINDISASFDNKNYYETTELFYTNTIKFTYTLSNEKSSVKILKNKKEI